jgi:hypothetical protein
MEAQHLPYYFIGSVNLPSKCRSRAVASGHYPLATGAAVYVRPVVKIEIGARSDTGPPGTPEIVPYLTAAGLSQAQLARRMKTSQSYIARIEGGKVRPSTSALERFAQATRTRLIAMAAIRGPSPHRDAEDVARVAA